MNVVIYSRVSTQTQDNKRQIEELKVFSKKHGYEVLAVFQEKVSGIKKNEERKALMDMINFVNDNEVEKVLCWELSRLGRSTVEVLKTIEILTENKISLFIKNFNLETLDENGNKNPLSNLLLEILSSINTLERTTTRQRIKSGYDHFRANGGKVGRKKGFRKSEEQILEDHKDVVKYLKKGYSVREIMKITERSSGTVMKVKKLLG